MMEPVKMPKPRQGEHEEEQEQEQEHIQGHQDPRYMKLGAREAYKAGYTGSIRSVKLLGEMAELSTIERGSTNERQKVEAILPPEQNGIGFSLTSVDPLYNPLWEAL